MRLVICKGVFLPVDEVLGGFDIEAVIQDAVAALRRWSQENHLFANLNRTVVGVMVDVDQGNVYR